MLFATLLLSCACALTPPLLSAPKEPILSTPMVAIPPIPSSVDSLMLQYGMVEVTRFVPSIVVDLRYATADNFTGQQLYTELNKAYLEKGFAERLVRAQRILSKRWPGYRFIIFDAARPISVQRKMYALVANTPLKVYVANGNRGGRHNYGVAVDLSIVDAKGKLLDMGTPFDYFGEEAHTDQEERLVREGRISHQARSNRELLRQILGEVGLRCYHREWWHFQERIEMKEVRRRYRLLDF
ncbi:M15 family metallopeptidase [Porphyromonas gingivicanis]|uniref:M15 family metallopeptidase n=1 Tax=Porphyromonas gingivicanis TaxID=266762 RepID=UPI000B13FEE2|nr:M15 family metallopeptidase [Porphyromonas gingivicanis]